MANYSQEQEVQLVRSTHQVNFHTGDRIDNILEALGHISPKSAKITRIEVYPWGIVEGTLVKIIVEVDEIVVDKENDVRLS